MFSLESGWGGVDFRSIWAEKIMFSLEPGGGGSIFGSFVRCQSLSLKNGAGVRYRNLTFNNHTHAHKPGEKVH